jgi:hypothetical protein
MDKDLKEYFLKKISEYKTMIPAEKYNKAGIYCIKVNGEIVYIGRSQDMQNRIANHIFWLVHSPVGEGNEKKYKELHEAYKKNIPITFDVLTFVEKDDIMELKRQEAIYIRAYMPVLNSDIPQLDNYKGYRKTCGALNL